MNSYCLFHASCADGFASALAIWQKYKDKFIYLPVQYGQPCPILKEEYVNQIFIVDFSYPLETMVELEERCNQLTVIDHHDLKEPYWVPREGNIFIYDDKHSGAILTWNLFNAYEEAPLFFKYIEDRDLWKWQLPNSREFSAGLNLESMDFELWNRYIEDPLDIQETIRKGYIILKYINQQVENLGKKAVICTDNENRKYALINSCLFQSELGEWLNKNANIDYADIFFINDKGQFVHSLRSGKANVTEIAKLHGGNGHPSGKSAGYTEDIK
jgi:uncharacterized protein